MNQIDEKIADLEREIEQLKAERDGVPGITDKELKDLAIYIHDRECKYSHTDQCSWSYEISYKNGKNIHDWSRSAHQMALERAKKYLKDFDIPTIKQAVDIRAVSLDKAIEAVDNLINNGRC